MFHHSSRDYGCLEDSAKRSLNFFLKPLHLCNSNKRKLQSNKRVTLKNGVSSSKRSAKLTLLFGLPLRCRTLLVDQFPNKFYGTVTQILFCHRCWATLIFPSTSISHDPNAPYNESWSIYCLTTIIRITFLILYFRYSCLIASIQTPFWMIKLIRVLSYIILIYGFMKEIIVMVWKMKWRWVNNPKKQILNEWSRNSQLFGKIWELEVLRVQLAGSFLFLRATNNWSEVFLPVETLLSIRRTKEMRSELSGLEKKQIRFKIIRK